jgi:hypothetical protein
MFEATNPPEPEADPSRSTFAWIIFCCGLLFYFMSYFLPAVAVSRGDIWPGWKCAQITLAVWIDPGFFPFGGLINVLAPIYVVLFALNRASRFRMIAAMLLTANLVLVSVLVLANRDMSAAIGFYIWIASLLLVIGGDLWNGVLWVFHRGEPVIPAR